jgi:hypothetical protein
MHERWIKLTAKLKLAEKSHSKQRENDAKADYLTKEVDLVRRRADMLEKENKYLRDQTNSRERTAAISKR